jgi:hypothetical protein
MRMPLVTPQIKLARDLTADKRKQPAASRQPPAASRALSRTGGKAGSTSIQLRPLNIAEL